MALSPGSRLGSYEILAAIAVGGMGEVFRARDTKLNRDVAIKVLLPAVANDPDRLARFSREAQVLASLNHPNIAHIYGIEEAGGVTGLILELVEGEDLAQRIARGPLPLDEALPIAKQIAEALEAAHEQGIIHRDLKPANIKVRPDGTVKVLDFGLAKAIEGPGGSGRAGGPGGLENSPTLSMHATQAGIILGTAAYMSPEQARGKAVDRRTDLWAFGCVLFEMLTGKRAFAGDDVTDTIVSVVSKEPDWSALPPDMPAPIRRLLRRCLDKDRKRRLESAGDARLEIDDGVLSPGGEAPVPDGRRTPSRRTGMVVALGVITLVAATLATVAWRPKSAAAVPLRKFDLALNTSLAELSPDGSRIAYLTGEHLFVRDLAVSESRDLGPASPEINSVGWSPDSSTIVTASRDGKVRTVPARGGPTLVVCEIPESHQTMGLVWVGDEMVIAVWQGGLYRVDARGGTPKLWLAADPAKETDFHALAALPGGRMVFATHLRNNEYVIETFDGTTRATLLPPNYIGGFWYAPSGHLLFTRFDANAGLWALPLGRAPLDIKQAFLVAPRATSASVANDGTLLVLTGTDAADSFELITRDRSGGRATVVGAAAAAIQSPAVSPDGRRVAMVRSAGSQQQVWVQDTAGAGGTRLTFDDMQYAHPAWFTSGDRLLYSERAPSPRRRLLTFGGRVFAVAADGSGKRQPLAEAYRAEVSPDGRDVVYGVEERGAVHLRHLALGPDSRALTVADAQRVFSAEPEPDVRDFALSPDGRLLAYVDYKSGLADVLVTRYPTAEGKWQVVANGGRALWGSDHALRWARGTNELLFTVSASDPEGGRMMAATVRADAGGVTIGQPAVLFEMDADALAGGFDVTPDGQTFFLRRRAAAQHKNTGPRFTLIQNWLVEFADRGAAK